MNDLEIRLRALAEAPMADGAPVPELRRRATRRARRRRALVIGVPLVVAVVALTAVLATRPDHRSQVRTAGVPRTTQVGPTTTAERLGDKQALDIRRYGVTDDVNLSVSPHHEVNDGDLLTVHVTGFQQLGHEPLALFCAGDLTADDATESCDIVTVLQPVHQRGSQSAGFTGEAQVTARRVLRIHRGAGDGTRAWDCAKEAAGCVLLVAPLTLPLVAVATPIQFRDAPLPEPRLTLDRSTDLHPGDQVTARVDGLRRNTAYYLTTCRASDGSKALASCGPSTLVAASDTTDRDPRLSIVAGFYGGATGRTDCSVDACVVTVLDTANEVVASAPFHLAAGVRFPALGLTVAQPGPYGDGQAVSVRGVGFPPGVDVGHDLAVCSNDVHLAAEDRCTRPSVSSPAIVGHDGTIAAQIHLTEIPACATVGCSLAWIPDGGTPVGDVPISFR